MSAKAPSASKPAAPVYQLKVTLHSTWPPVWRRLLVPADVTLWQLHEVLQRAFGWWRYHLHVFEVGRERYGDVVAELEYGFGDQPLCADERHWRLNEVFAAPGQELLYRYDFGDDWRHQVRLEKVLPGPAERRAECVDGRRARPPEDCGGSWLVDEAKLPQVKAAREVRPPSEDDPDDDNWVMAIERDWPGPDEAWDQAAINARLAKFRLPRKRVPASRRPPGH